jgi:oligoribonuclease
MPTESALLTWVDIETTGLDPAIDSILEVGLIVTTGDLTIVSATSTVVAPNQRRLDQADEVVRRMHDHSGLAASYGAPVDEAERFLLHWLTGKVGKGESPMCGSSVHFDRGFLARHMPDLEAHFHYRNIDVSAVAELCSRWFPHFTRPPSQGVHRVLPDLVDSIEALKFFRADYFRPS